MRSDSDGTLHFIGLGETEIRSRAECDALVDALAPDPLLHVTPTLAGVESLALAHKLVSAFGEGHPANQPTLLP